MKRKYLLVFPIAALVVLAVWRVRRHNAFAYAGTVEVAEVHLSARLAAPLTTLPVPEGAAVKAGDVVARLDAADLKLAADNAEKDYRRGRALNVKGSLSEEALDRLQFRRDDTAVRLSWATIVAPLTGTVIRRYREPGEWVVPGQKILTVADVSSPFVVVYVPAPVMARRALGEPVTVRCPDLGQSFDGRIVFIRSDAEFTPKNVQTRTERERLVFGIKVAIANPDGRLKAGMSVEVEWKPRAVDPGR
ncbi:MAG: efflux RND transporter periplasmic adaptor subunit [Elusimicrobia bacterium]|jgi:HlyD family secretion protein|nr:efflux RND transporter periplasmic adaptor subunit [Elusimicrobiota bacterium]MBK7207533.1 efflux RND transporter periplasmic adaptor subunit [Elusimicrobiota bacterium]MBK7544303.1 efflux RND transporter periplasmic adaptor subunit [Elusimicrobiota bacterium]MBK7573825.1 efflux RND transporter periplasmic adaptor subunit [Elusimicrobiota bacterium]MBK7689423.1 efflux RND transporter periplasmic adaptor subunit [Elusimicrobiota bacterium]